MRPDDMQELIDRRPFVPFRIFLTDGNHLDVTRTLSVAVMRNQIFIVLPDDRWKFIPLRHITSVETLQPA